MATDSAVPHDAASVAAELATRLEQQGCSYAIGGALALAYSSEPRATLDIDVTLFIPVEDKQRAVEVLEACQCDFRTVDLLQGFADHGFAQVRFQEIRVDVFLPLNDFYQAAEQRRQKVQMAGREVYVWDAATLCVFKLMFFRLKDFADIEAILRAQGKQLDRAWIGQQVEELFGKRDPRVARWQELAEANPVD